MDLKQTLITFPKPGSSSDSKRVQFSRSRTEVNGNTKRDEGRRTKSASRYSARTVHRLLSAGHRGQDNRSNQTSTPKQTLFQRTPRSRDSRKTTSRDDSRLFTPSTDYRRLGSMRTYESSISIARRERDAKLRFKLKLWSHVLVYFQKLHQKIIKNNQELEAYKKQMEYTDGNFVALDENSTQVGLDVDHYKPVTQIRMSKEAKRILHKDPDLRTLEEIKHVRTDLMVTKNERIQTLPEDCQLRLARNVGLESLGAKRFIIKEGHIAEYCYLIIVGSVIKAWIDENTMKATSEEKPLKEGQMFGETVEESSSPRKASYISSSYTEILRINSEDYYDIFMAGENVRTDDVLLLKQIDIFKGWNIDGIKNNRDKLKRKYFPNTWWVKEKEEEDEEKRNKVIDSRNFEWIYIVKSGSIDVMKQMDNIKPTINRKTGHYVTSAHTDGYLAFLTKGAEYERFAAYHSSKAPSRPLTATTIQADQEPPLLSRLNRLLRPHTSANERFICTPDSLKGKQLPKSAISSKLVSIPRKRRQSFNLRKDNSSSTNTPETLRNDSSLTEELFNSTPKDFVESRLDKESSTLTECDIVLFPNSRKKHVTIHNTEKNNKNEEGDSVICKIKTLTKGDVFGLEYIVFDVMDEKNQPGFILRSNGSECIMINKKVYKEIITDNFDLKEKLRSDVSPYPEDDDLKENFLLRINWELHKDIHLKDLMSEKARLRPQKHGQKFIPRWK